MEKLKPYLMLTVALLGLLFTFALYDIEFVEVGFLCIVTRWEKATNE